MRLCGFYESSPTRTLWLYCDPYVKFEDPTFDDFNAIKTLTNNLLMDWFSNLNGSEDDVYLAFYIFNHKYHVYYTNGHGSAGPQPITKEAFK
jgi:hypothetical protein